MFEFSLSAPTRSQEVARDTKANLAYAPVNVAGVDRLLRLKEWVGSMLSRLVQRIGGGVFQPLDLVLDHQLPALEFGNLQIIR
jgi:hypothetical protein